MMFIITYGNIQIPDLLKMPLLNGIFTDQYIIVANIS